MTVASAAVPPAPWILRTRWRLFGTVTAVLAVLMGTLAFLVAVELRRSLESDATAHNRVVAALITRAVEKHLPDLPGSGVLRQLREDPRTREIPVVILSADATPGAGHAAAVARWPRLSDEAARRAGIARAPRRAVPADGTVTR